MSWINPKTSSRRTIGNQSPPDPVLLQKAEPTHLKPANTTVITPPDPAFRSAVRLALAFAAVKLLLHIVTTLWTTDLGYGYFRDEFYYIACGRRLAWGYVDHGPLVALQARLATFLFGSSILGIRMLSFLSGATRVFLTGLLAHALGGRRPAQALAMLCVLLAPAYLGIDSFLSMNSVESLFWMSSLLALLEITKLTSSKQIALPWQVSHAPQAARLRTLWIFLGISSGLGLLNKPSMTFFLLALLAALLLSPHRRVLFTRYAALGIALLVLIALPNVLWQIHNGWPTLEFLRNGKLENKNVHLGPLAFLVGQIMPLNPASALVWIPGLVYLLRRRHRRWLGITYLLFLAMMLAFGAKDYYVQPIYPVLFAAGGLAWERRFANRRRVQANRALAFPAATATLVLTGVLLLPLAIPVLAPDAWIRYTRATHLDTQSSKTENQDLGPLPQFFSDRFGWQEETDAVARINASLSPADQAKAAVLATNYGEAASLLFLGPRSGLKLPPVVSGHNNFYLWGPQHITGEVLIVINGATPEEMHKFYDEVTVAAVMNHPFAMPFEHRNIYLCRHRKKNLTEDWRSLKHYI